MAVNPFDRAKAQKSPLGSAVGTAASKAGTAGGGIKTFNPVTAPAKSSASKAGSALTAPKKPVPYFPAGKAVQEMTPPPAAPAPSPAPSLPAGFNNWQDFSSWAQASQNPAPVPSGPSLPAGISSWEQLAALNTIQNTPAPAAKPATENITIPDPLGDATYQSQVASLARQMADYKASQQLAQGQYDTNFNEGLRRLGWQGDLKSGQFDENNMAAGTLGQALNSTTDDFAARNGIFSSGYANQMQNARNSFSDRTRQLGTDRQAFMDTQANALKTYQNQNTEARGSAEAEAVARIAAQYGIDLAQVTPGRQNTISRSI